ncbi:saposin B domain-containing protein [Cavenderia fasciculata]|uniref:Sphingomyelin phosphodiesterase n=1 Tax=Cavenderia fasciculata TaxID=261658 RepID=F4Q6L6_CACFS|nr:saposin B domain-containing protein [Cavenderia fasciculata]EGG16526.1 saposin B domain-containing protein [Cavenderia fasciculata]|eukprot:XP_004354926.1 saposin B domain-containing protein [Cavenderia fasciculata]
MKSIIKLILFLTFVITIVHSHSSISIANKIKIDTNLVEDVKGVITCDLCLVVVKTVQAMLQTETGQQDVLKYSVDTCVLFKIEKPEVCEGLLPLFSNETFDIVGNKSYSPEYLCGFVGICPFTPKNFSGVVEFPKPKPPHVDPVPPKKGGPSATILHLSDLHVDTMYVAGSNNDCGEPICCRAHNGMGSGPTAAGYWGDYHCDVNMPTLISMLEHIASEHTIDYIQWTGDNVPHDIWMQTRETQLNATHHLTNLIKQYFPGVPVFPSIGNHEAVPVNAMQLPPNSNWLFSALTQYWGEWLDDDALSTLDFGGYYTVMMPPPLQNTRMVSLNMNWCNDQNLYLLADSTNPAGMITWLVNTLQAAEDAGQKVYIIGHIPPGISDCVDVISQQLYQIVNRYEDSIVASFYGHTHRDGFEVYRTNDTTNRPSGVVYITPSTTTFQNQNPSYRIYTVDIDSSYLVESSTYHIDLDQANQAGNSSLPIWKLEYNATDVYQMDNLFAQDWQDVITRFSTNHTMLTDYYNRIYSSSPYPIANPCTSNTCIQHTLCELESTFYYQYKACIVKSYNNNLISLINHYEFINHQKQVC